MLTREVFNAILRTYETLLIKKAQKPEKSIMLFMIEKRKGMVIISSLRFGISIMPMIKRKIKPDDKS